MASEAASAFVPQRAIPAPTAAISSPTPVVLSSARIAPARSPTPPAAVAAAPPDKRHPYGHGNVEYYAAGIETVKKAVAAHIAG